jgi:outer membrane receptor for ferric coprogen and ferric-rhodotorulic acid
VSASGKFFLADREHDLTIGANWSKSTMADVSHYGQGIGTPLPDLNNWTGNYPQPTFDAGIDGSNYVDKRKSVYAAARFNLADDLKLITGATITRAESSGQSYGVGHRTSASDTTPYLGVVLDLSKNLSAYASYSAIFNPQTQTGVKGNPLDPVKGKSVELGLKSEFFDRKLNASVAVFKTKQSNAAEQAGYVGAKAYYTGIDAESQGLELDLSGELAEGLQASVGYTQLSISGSDGNAARTYVPRKLLRVSTTYQLPQLAQMKVGASVNWQDDTQRDQGGGIVTRQASYALLNLMARYDITKQLSISANLNNVTDKKYLTSLYWGQGFYGAPRNASVALHWKY